MNTLDFAQKYIRFDKSSPVTGAFNIDFYPFLRKPMESADDIRVKRLVILKASSCLGTVLGQIINAKRIVCDVGDQKMVCQSDEDASLWTKTRGKEWLRSIPDAMRLLSTEKYAMTNDLWLFRHKFLEISGPGINAAQSVQVRYVQTDESHLDAFPPGRLIEFEKRMGGRWDRQATHITTAPDAGKEIDGFYLEGQQDEWNFRCPKCAQLSCPLDDEDSHERYNGEEVFSQRSDGGVEFICVHCGFTGYDNARSRYDLVRDGDYESMNPSATMETNSYQWPVFAAHWISWRELFTEKRAAMEAAKLGNLKPLEDWRKKRLCRSWTPTIPDFGLTPRGSYNIGDVWVSDNPTQRFCSFDFQEGSGAVGVHWWGQCDEFTKGKGDSRRVDFRRLESWADCRAFQLHHGVSHFDTFCDAGHRDKEVFARCAEWLWYALIASDAEEFMHSMKLDGRPVMVPNSYYTQLQSQDSMSGKAAIVARKNGIVVPKGRKLPHGWCMSRTWSKPNIGFLLLRLKDGRLGYEYGIPRNIIDDYTKQLNSYVESIDIRKKDGQRARILKQIKEADHSFSTSSQNLLGAIIRGVFPLAKLQESENAA